MDFFRFFLLIAAGYGLSYQLMHSVSRMSGQYWLIRLILLPGVIVHELSHALACLLTGTPIETISFWTETGGQVVHHKPKLAFVTQPLISFAPFPVGMIGLLLISHAIPHEPWFITTALLFLMLSIAATLAPSRTDALHALEGSIVILGFFLATYFYAPSFITHLQPTVTTFNQQMLLVDGFLLAMWLVLFSLLRLLRR